MWDIQRPFFQGRIRYRLLLIPNLSYYLNRIGFTNRQSGSLEIAIGRSSKSEILSNKIEKRSFAYVNRYLKTDMEIAAIIFDRKRKIRWSGTNGNDYISYFQSN